MNHALRLTLVVLLALALLWVRSGEASAQTGVCPAPEGLTLPLSDEQLTTLRTCTYNVILTLQSQNEALARQVTALKARVKEVQGQRIAIGIITRGLSFENILDYLRSAQSAGDSANRQLRGNGVLLGHVVQLIAGHLRIPGFPKPGYTPPPEPFY